LLRRKGANGALSSFDAQDHGMGPQPALERHSSYLASQMTGLVPRAMQFSSPAKQVVGVQTALAVVDAVISTKAAAASMVFSCRRFIDDSFRCMPLLLQNNRTAKLFSCTGARFGSPMTVSWVLKCNA
jgi:hypothetical protein